METWKDLTYEWSDNDPGCVKPNGEVRQHRDSTTAPNFFRSGLCTLSDVVIFAALRKLEFVSL